MSTIRPTWPSADLWRRVQQNELRDESACPACRCPAVTHQRDALIGALFCPAVQTDQDRARMWAMLDTTAKYAGSAKSLNKRAPGNDAIARAAAEEQLVIEAEADVDELRPWLISILSRNPGGPLQEALAAARIARDKYRAGELRKLDAKVKAASSQDGFTYPPPEPRPGSARLQKKKDGGVLTVVKRRYDLED